MYITEEIIRKYSTLKVKDWEKAYSGLKELLEEGFKFTRIEEKDFRHHMDMGRVESKIICHKEMDKYTEIKLTLRPLINVTEDGSSAEVEIRSKGELVTEYPEETSFQKSLIYYAFRSLFDKLFYGWNREKWKGSCEELLNEVHREIRRFYRSV